MSNILKFEGYNYLRQRLILATLSGKPVRIEKIRSDDENPGLRGSFLL
jgi:RNA 3'-terminal phosphate cyclase-like protein